MTKIMGVAVVVTTTLTGCGDKAYGPDNPMPLDVAAKVVVDHCVDQLEDQDQKSWGVRYSSVDDCINGSGIFMRQVLDDTNTSVIGPDGQAIRSFEMSDRIEQRALEISKVE